MITITTVITTEGEKNLAITVKSQDFDTGTQAEKGLAIVLREVTMATINVFSGGFGGTAEEAKFNEFIKRAKSEGKERN